MARINLLPWRAEERARKNKEFISIIAIIALIALAAAFAVWSYFNNELKEQKRANDVIVQENTRLDGVLTEIEDLEQRHEEIVSRMKIIQDLQGKRPIPVRVWDDLARAMPADLYLINIKRDGDLITLKGKADNPNVVSNLIRRLDASNWMDGSRVLNIKRNNEIADRLAKAVNYANYEAGYVEFEVTTKIEAAVTEAKEGDESTNSAEAGG